MLGLAKKQRFFHLIMILNLFLFNIYLLMQFQNNVYFFDPYDSNAYFEFSLYPVFRMPIITGIYTLFADFQNIIIFQYSFYLLSASLLIISFYLYFGPKISTLIGTLILSYFFGNTVMIEHNYKLTSEGLNVSSFLIFLAILMLAIKYNNIHSFLLLLISLIFLSGTKAVTALVSAIVLPLLIFKFRKIIFLPRINILYTFIFIVPIYYLSFATFSSDYSKNYTTSSIINERLWLNENWKNQVLESGFPLIARQTWEAYKNQNLGLPPDNAVINNSAYRQWYENRGGEDFLLKFMLKNPGYTLGAPFCLPCFSENFTFKQTVLSGWTQGTDEIKINPDLKTLNENRTVFWPNEPENAYLLLALALGLIGIMFLASTLIPIRESSGQIFFIFIALTYGLIYSLISWYFGSKANDMNRHQLLMAVDLRVVSIFAFTAILGLILKIIRSQKIIDE